MDRRPLLISLVIASLAAGCTQHHGKVYTSGTWPKARETLGRVAVLSVRGNEIDSPEKCSKITKLIETALCRLPNTQIVATDSLESELDITDASAPVSDYDLVMAARKLGIDTVCFLKVAHYNYTFMFGFALIIPVWDSSVYLNYDMRIIDVPTGRLLLETTRDRTKRLAYAGNWRSDLAEEFSKDLEWVLTACTPKEPDADSP